VIVAAAAPVEAAPVPVAVQADAPQAPIAPEPAPQASTTSASSSLVAALDWVYGDSSGAIAANNDATSLETSAAPADIPETTSDLATPIDTLSDVAPVQAVANPDDAIPGERRVIQVQRGDTLFGLLTQAGLSEAEAQAAGHSLSDVFSPSDLKAGQRITLNLASADGSDGSPTPAGKLVGLTLAPSAERDVKLSRDSDGQFVAASVDRPLTERTALAAGQIDTSLFENARDAGVPVALIGDIIKAFSYDVDFQRDIHDGDSFEAVFERFDTTNGDLVKAGRLLYASLTLGDKPLAIYYFERDGDGEYYTSDGQAVRKSLLKTPIDGAKITSGYGMRVNPILGYSMMHQGIDFGAPIGTPIYAAGNGTVEEMGEKNGYGNYMKLRHNGTYETAYGHISRFASGLKRGTKVKQGEVIAYVGETGRATGPHLHFEILVNGAHVNPASVKTVAADKLTGKDLNAFRAQVAAINLQRKTLANRSEIADQSGTAAPLDCSRLHGCQN
jgi:murein DD-endopeptidase MepM/ murein hydrolase activator NlpD